MHREFFRAVRADRAYPCVVPDISAVAAGVAKPECIGMLSRALLEHEHQLVFRAIEGAHAAVGLVPDHKVLELGKARRACPQQLSHVAPVHTDERDRAIAHDTAHVAKGGREEVDELVFAHLATGKGELAVLD